jgi:hypothetical protein
MFLSGRITMSTQWSSWAKRSLPISFLLNSSPEFDESLGGNFPGELNGGGRHPSQIHPDSTVQDIMEINPRALLCLLEFHPDDDTFCGVRGEETLREIGDRTGVPVDRIVYELRSVLLKS